MLSNFIFGLVIFLVDLIGSFIRGVFVLIVHVFGWPAIIAITIIVWALWRFGFI